MKRIDESSHYTRLKMQTLGDLPVAKTNTSVNAFWRIDIMMIRGRFEIAFVW